MRLPEAAMINPSDIHTLTDFKRNSSDLIQRLSDSDRPLALTIEGRAKVIVLGVAAFERLAALADSAEALLGIRRGLEDVKAGRTMSLDEFRDRVRKLADSESAT